MSFLLHLEKNVINKANFTTNVTKSYQNDIVDSIGDLERLNNEELEYKFKVTLKAVGVTSTWKFEDACRAMKDTAIFKFIKTYNEKRRLFNDFISSLKFQEHQTTKIKREKTKEDFFAMLSEDHSLSSDSTYIEALAKFSSDARWRSVEEKERENLYENYLDLLYKKEEFEKRKAFLKKRESLRQKIKAKGYSHNVTWNQFKRDFKDDPLVISMDKFDVLDEFRKYVIDLEEKEEKRVKEEERYNNFIAREKFREMLEILAEKKILKYNTKYKDLIKEIYNKEEYTNLIGNEGSTPFDLFADKIEEMKAEYKNSKIIMNELINRMNIKFDWNNIMSLTQFKYLFNKYKEFRGIKDYFKEELYEHLTQKLSKQKSEHQSYISKITNKLLSYLQRKKLNFNSGTEFDLALEEIKKFDKFKNISKDNIKEAFYIIKEKLKEKTNENVDENKGEKDSFK